MKFLSNLLATVCVAGSIVAAEQTPSEKQVPCPIFVTLESPDYSFETTFTALFMQPFANNLDYAAEAFPFNYGFGQPALSPSWEIPRIASTYHWGFDVGISGICHDSKSGFMLNWERLHSHDDSNFTAAAITNDMVGPFFEIGPDASFYKKARGYVNFHFDEVNLDYGVFLHLGNRLHMNLFAGVGFARILQHRFTKFSSFSEGVARTIRVPSKFIGAGPQMGMDFTYKIVKGFQFVGNTRTSLFAGHFKNKTTYSTASGELVAAGDPSPNIQHTRVKNKGGVVPGLEGKLGLAYEYLFGCHYMVKLEAGYKAQIYLNSIRSIDMGSEVALNSVGSVGSQVTGVYARTFERTVSDFSLSGPYATLDLAF